MTLGAQFAEVLTAAQSGAEWALTALYRDVNPVLVRYLDSRAPGDGEDISQETWLAAAPKLAAFVGDEHQFRSWLFTIAHRRLVAPWRRSAARPVTSVSGERLAVLGSSGDDPDELSAREAIAELMIGLSADQVDVVLLRVVGGFTVEEVAAIIGKRPGAVRTTQHRALRRLAERLSERVVTK